METQPVIKSVPEKKGVHVSELSHVDDLGRARMVDVGDKPETVREARAQGAVLMQPSTLRLIQRNEVQKGDVLAVAKIAGIMAAKRTAELIPLCHPLALTSVDLSFRLDVDQGTLEIESIARITGKTGVEMEALTAVAAAALTVYDMCKAVDRAMTITAIRLIEKRGGRSGVFRRSEEPQ
jgi:cyclic pyranopterin phosphate synthase